MREILPDAVPQVPTRRIRLTLDDAQYQAAHERFTAAQREQIALQGRVDQSMARGGKTIGAAAREVETAGGVASRAAGRLAKAGGEVAGASAGMSRGLGVAKTAMSAVTGVAVAAGLSLTTMFGAMARGVAQAKAMQDAMVAVRKTTGLSQTEIQGLTRDLYGMSARLGIAAPTLAGFATAAGQLGIQGARDLNAFVETAAKLSAVSDLSTDDAAEGIAKIARAYGVAVSEAERIGSVVNELSNTTAATAGAVVDVLRRVGTAGSSVGLTVAQVAALGATLVDAGVDSERGGTALRNALVLMQTEAGKIAPVLGMTERAFRDAFSEDALGTMLKYLDALKAMESQSRTAHIDDVFGKENLLQVATLAEQVDRLRENLGTADDAFSENTSLSREFGATFEVVQGQVDRLTAKVSAFLSGIGAPFLEPIYNGLKALNLLTASSAELGEEYQTLQGKIGEQRQLADAADTYDQLAGKQNLTAEESARLRSALDLIQRQAPGFVSAVNSNGQAVGVFSGALRELTTATMAQYRAQQLMALGGILQQYGAGRSASLSGQRDQRDYAGQLAGVAGQPGNQPVAAGGGSGQYSGALRTVDDLRRTATEGLQRAGLRSIQGRADTQAAAAQLEEIVRGIVAGGDSVEAALGAVESAARQRGVTLSGGELRELRRRSTRERPVAAQEITPDGEGTPYTAPPDPERPETARQRAARLRREQKERDRQEDERRRHDIAMREYTTDTAQVGTSIDDAAELAALDERAERLRQERAEREALTAAITDQDERRRQEAMDTFQYDRQGQRLARERIEVETAQARTDSDERLASDKLDAEKIENVQERARAVELAEAQHLSRLGEINDRYRLDTLKNDGDAQGSRLRLFQSQAEDQERAAAEAAERFADQTADAVQTTNAVFRGQEVEGWASEIREGLVTSFADIQRGTQTLRDALEHAGTDEERKRIQGLLNALDGLGTTLDAVAARAAKSRTGRMVEDLETAVGLADDLNRAFEEMGATVLASVSRSVGDVLSAVEKIGRVKEQRDSGQLSGTAGQLAALGAAAGLVGTAVGVVGGIVSAMRAHREAIEAARRATEQNTAAMLREGQIGADTTRPQVDAALATADRLDALLADYLDGLSGMTATQAVQSQSRMERAFEQELRGLEDQGVNVDDIRATLEAGDLRGAIDDLRERFGALGGAMGNYTDSLDGAFAEYEDAVRFLGLEGQDAIREFLRLLRASGEDLGGLTAFVNGADAMTDEERAAAVAAIYEQIRVGSFDFGGLSPAEVERVLTQALSGGSGGSGASQAGSVSSITATQGSELLGYQQEQLRALRGILSELTRIGAGVLAPPTSAVATSGSAASVGTGGVTLVVQIDVHDGPTNDEIVRVASEGIGRKLDMARPGGRTARR